MLIVGGVGVAGIAFWYFFFGPGATPAAAAAPSTTAANPGSTAWNSPSNAAEVQVISAWVPGTPAAWQSFFDSYMPTATQQEITNMANMILVWDGTQPATTSLTNWWYAFSAAHGLK